MMNLLNGLELHNQDPFNFDGIATIVFYFMVYSFLGWLLENNYSFFTNREFFKANFLWGPFKPMYGFTPLLLLFLITENTHWPYVILLCFFIPTLVEYVSGFLLLKLFQRQWWDYSDIPMHLHGHICLPFSTCWIFLSLICLKWIHPIIEASYEVMEPYWVWVWPSVLLYFLTELVWAIRRHSLQALIAEKSTNPLHEQQN